MMKSSRRSNALAALVALAGFLAPGCSGQQAEPGDDPAAHHDPGSGPGRSNRPGPTALAPDWSVDVRRAARAKTPAALEFVIASKRPIPARAADPVLLVGDTPVRDYHYAAPDTLVFTTTELDTLPERAELVLAWSIGREIVSRGAPLGSFDKQRALTGQASGAAPR